MKDLKPIIDALKPLAEAKKAEKIEREAVIDEFKNKEKQKKLTLEQRIERLERLNGLTL